MRFHRLSLLLFLVCSLAVAESKPTEEAANGATLPKDEKEFLEKSSKLTSLTNRIEAHERAFQEHVRGKALAKTPEAKQEYIKLMLQVTDDRNKDVAQYNKLKSELALRYPNQGERLNRRYKTQTKRTIEEMEGVLGLDELLTRTKKIVEKKFAPFDDKDAEPTPEMKPVAAPTPEEKPKLRLEK